MAQPGLYKLLAKRASFGAWYTTISSLRFQIKVFFLLCVIVAGAYGAATVSRRIFYVQAEPR